MNSGPLIDVLITSDQRWPPELRTPAWSQKYLIAFGASVAAHVAVLVGLTAWQTESPRIASAQTIEVALVGLRASAPRRAPAATVAVAPRSTRVTPVSESDSSPGESKNNGDSGENAIIDARHDVAGLNNPQPPYPLAARRRGIEGRVILRAHVHADGSCGDVVVKQSSGHDTLDSAALDTVRRWRFLPAQRSGRAIAAWVEVPIVFRLTNNTG